KLVGKERRFRAREIDAHLAHRLDDLRMYARGGLGPRRDRSRLRRVYARVEERRGHLRAPGVVNARKEDRGRDDALEDRHVPPNPIELGMLLVRPDLTEPHRPQKAKARRVLRKNTR